MPATTGNKQTKVAFVRKFLEEIILSSNGPQRAKLPSSRQLAMELGVSRNTVLAAYQELIAEGFAEPKSKSGVFVNSEILSQLSKGRKILQPTTPKSERFQFKVAIDTSKTSLPEIHKPYYDWHKFKYPFICGQVNANLFPSNTWLRYLSMALEPIHRNFSLSDDPEHDDPLLVTAICRRILPSRGIKADPSMILITMGTQEGLFLIADALFDESSTIAMENPGYPDARHIFIRSNAKVVGATVDDFGLVPESIPDGVDAIYTTPSHQFPTNATLSISRRRRLLDMANENGMVVIEDDYDSELRYIGRPTPALLSLAGAEPVLYLGSFSKFLAPGLRLGFLVGPPSLIRILRQRQRYVLRHPPGHLQRALALMIEQEAYARHLRRYRASLKRSWQVTTDSVRDHLPAVKIYSTAGGTSFWVELDPSVDAVELTHNALEEGIVIEPGNVYFLEENPPKNFIRIGFGAIEPRNIEAGIQLLGDIIRRFG